MVSVWKSVAVAAVLATTGGGGYMVWAGNQAPKPPKAVTACQEEVKEQLRSPSTFELIKWRQFDEDLSKEQYRKARIGPGTDVENDTAIRAVVSGIDERSDKYGGPVHRSFILEYDAANAFGTPIREAHVCQYALKNRYEEISDFMIQMRRSDLLLKRLRS